MMKAKMILVTPFEAIALSRLLDAYIATEESDPSLPTLKKFLIRLKGEMSK